MATKAKTCVATTESGDRCTRTAMPSGFCKMHEQKNKKDRQSNHYYEVINVILDLCKIKNWAARLENEDPDRQLIEINVSRHVELTEITAIIHATIENGVKVWVENTSFHDYGLKELGNSIGLKLRKLDWLVSDDQNRKQEEVAAASQLIVRILRNFDRSARQLNRRYNNRAPYEINDEYDVQDLLHSILRAYFEDVRPEEYTPSYAGSSSKVDFLLKIEKSIIEVKFATKALREKKVGEELIIDISKYQTHPDCNALYCLVYDPGGNIHNPAGLENDLSGKHNNMMVTVLVVPN